MPSQGTRTTSKVTFFTSIALLTTLLFALIAIAIPLFLFPFQSLIQSSILAQNFRASSTNVKVLSPVNYNLNRLKALYGHLRSYSNMAAIATEDGSAYFRLPRNVIPTHYDLTLISDIKELNFQGIVTINLDIHEETDKVILNVHPKLNVAKCLVTSEALKTESRSLIDLSIDEKHERVTANLAQKLPKGSKATITIAYDGGEIDNSMSGFYRSTTEVDGVKSFYALTQFEPTAARKAMPSFDEPAMKATFKFTMIHRKNTVPLSNMPVTQSKDISLSEAHKLTRLPEFNVNVKSQSGKTEVGKTVSSDNSSSDSWTITSFGTTPVLPTYLFAWANGEFEVIESSYKSIDGRTVPLRVYATKEYIHQTQFTLDVTKKVLPVSERIFQEPYMMPKCDTLVATDFDAGAMENAGLITGRTSVYLYDPAKSGIAGQKRTAGVQAHELSHQWFGNLSTLEWWTQLWLNESFATLMGESILMDKVFPELNSGSEFITNHLFRALELDCKRSSHPIEVPLQGEDVESAINQIFDAISYAKGASVLRMLSEMIGQDVFLQGVAKYIQRFKFKNAVTKDLFDAISEEAGMDVSKIMESWVLKQGYPVVTVTEQGDKLHVKQNRLLLNLKPEEDKTIWHIPLMLKSADGKVSRDLFLTEREQTLPLPSGGGAWKLNAGTIGVYRTAYSPEHLAKLGQEATRENSNLTLEDRVGLVSDAFVLSQAGYAKTSGALTLIKALRNDPTYLVNSATAASLADLGSVWWEQPKEIRDAIERFRGDVFGPAAKRLGFEFPEGESPEARQLRSTIIGAAAGGGDSWTIDQMKANFAPLLKDPQDDSKIHADLMQVTFRTAVKYGGRAEYEAVKAIYNKPATPSHKNSAMLAMGSSRDEKICKETIDFMYKHVKEQDFMYYFASLSANPISRRMIMESLQENLDEISKRFLGSFMIVRLVEYATRTFTTQKDYDSIKKFFDGKDTKRFNTGLSQGLDQVSANAFWLEHSAKDVEEWLRENQYLN